MRCVGGERTTPMEVDTREGELRSPRLPFVLLVGLPSLTTPFHNLFHTSTSPPLMRCVGDGREGTTPMDVDTHAAPEGELPSPHPLAPDAER